MAGVVRLVTFVDLRDDDDAGPEALRMSLTARHEAELAGGRRIVLLDDRGWTGELFVAGGGEPPEGIWAHETEHEIARTARFVVGPDEPFEGRTQTEMAAGHWQTLAHVLQREGLDADRAELEALPHDVELSDRLRARIEPSRTGMESREH
jgi:hypothetical protein